MSMKWLGACMWSWVHVYETVGCMSMKRLGPSVRPSVRPSVHPSASRPSVRLSVRLPSAVRRPPPVRRLPPSPLWVWSGSRRLLLFSAAASLALPLLCSCCVPSLPFLLSACLLVPRASAPPWDIYTITLSRLFQFLVWLRLNSAFLGTGLVGLLVQGRLRGQGEMPGPQ